MRKENCAKTAVIGRHHLPHAAATTHATCVLRVDPSNASTQRCFLVVQRVMRLLHTALTLGLGGIVIELTLKLAKVSPNASAKQRYIVLG